MTDVENTSKRHPADHLMGLMSEGNDGYIEGMEAAGQAEVLLSDRIPTSGPFDESLDAQLVALGFTLGEPDADDPIFRPCALPDGWRREASDRSMWSYIVDTDGYRRVAIFYKAAFYDRSAHFRIERVPRTRKQADAWETVDPPEHPRVRG
jgi:hypothetical protein